MGEEGRMSKHRDFECEICGMVFCVRSKSEVDICSRCREKHKIDILEQKLADKEKEIDQIIKINEKELAHICDLGDCIDKLKDKLETVVGIHNLQRSKIDELEKELSQKEKLLELAIEALDFYADCNNWLKQNQKKATRNNVTDCSFIRYGGERARQALEQLKEI